MLLPYLYQVTKYNPADRNEYGRYTGTETQRSDHGPVEAAYLQAVSEFAKDTQVTRLAIREPGITWINFGLEATIDGHGLTGLFPPDLTGFHDGAEVTLATALKLVRAMLRDNGAWCTLEAEGRFLVRVGYDQYISVGSAEPCERAVTLTGALGLFAERVDPHRDDLEEDQSSVRRSADAQFWAELAGLARAQGTVIVEEGYVYNRSRWHRLTSSDVPALRARLTPRSRLWVWPDLSFDVDTTLEALPADDTTEIVWMDQHGQITSLTVDDEDIQEVPALLAGAQAAMLLPITVDDRHPLLTAVLPDPDGVLRARWTP